MPTCQVSSQSRKSDFKDKKKQISNKFGKIYSMKNIDPTSYRNTNWSEDNESSISFLSEDPYKSYIKEKPDIGRNEPCPFGSGIKYKNCCLGKNK